MFRLVADAHLSAEILLALRRVNRSACAASRIRDCFGGRGGGRLGDNLIIQSFSNLQELQFLKKEKLTKANISEKKIMSKFGRLPATRYCGHGQSPFCYKRFYFFPELLIRSCDKGNFCYKFKNEKRRNI
jgi:hypothetical protein